MSAPAVNSSSHDGPGGFLVKSRAKTKPRREVIHAWPCYPTPPAAATLQQVVDANGNVVRGNLFHGSPVLYEVAGLPNTLRDSQCHGPQLELWILRGANMLRDVVTRIVDADTPNAQDTRTTHANKMTRRRQNYRDQNKLGLFPGFHTTGLKTRGFAALMSRLTNDQIMLASPWEVDLTRMVMINPKNGDVEPLFRPQEVPQRVRQGLDTARLLSASQRAKLGWTNIPNPPTLAAWLSQNPQFLGYNPQDEFYTNPWYVDRRAGAFVLDSDDDEEEDNEEEDDEEEADGNDFFDNDPEVEEEHNGEKDDEDFPDSDIEADVQPLPARDLAGASIVNTAAATPLLEAKENSELVAAPVNNTRSPRSHDSNPTMSSTQPTEEGHDEQAQATAPVSDRLTRLFGEGVIPPPGRYRYPVTLDEDRVMYSPVIIMVAERDDLPPWFVYKNRGRQGERGPGLEHIAFLEQHPELRTKPQLLEAIVAEFVLFATDRERYRNSYNSFAAGTMSRRNFEQTVIHQLAVMHNKFCMAMHEQLMRMHGGEAWQFVQKQGYNNEFWDGGASLATR
ncbi:hypothetical protein EG328_005787, partial [Venturia inaequalis]